MYKNHLNLQDIHIGDWVQEYSEITGKLSMPMYVSAIFADGTIYLDFNGNEGDVWESNIEDIAPIRIEEDVMKGFGFREKAGVKEFIYDVGDLQIRFDTNPRLTKFFLRHSNGDTSPCFDSYYIHQLQDVYSRFTHKALVLNWKGI